MIGLFSVIFVLAGYGVVHATNEQRPEDRPLNVVLLLVDDWGWTDGGVFGSDLYETPAIDRLAADGVRFTQAYAACTVCSPTRAALMTGKNPARLRVTDWIAGHSTRFQNRRLLEPNWTKYLAHEEVTVAERLRAMGYRTASVGKWHLTPDGEPGSPRNRAYYPEHHGFDVNVAGNRWGMPGGFFAPYGNDRRVMVNMPDVPEGTYLTDALTNETVRLIDAWRADPFFIYLPYFAVHTPIQAREDLIAKFTPKVRPDGTHRNPVYAGMVAAVDESVARIRAALESAGVADRTLIILTGDNGGLLGGGETGITSNVPLRDGKGSVYEGGVRVPAVAYLPGGAAGAVEDQPVITMDFTKTIVALTGADASDMPDGVDLSSVLQRGRLASPPRDLFWHYPHYHIQGAEPYSAIRSGDYRLIEYHADRTVELYHLAEDIGETTNLAEREPDRVRELLGRLDSWRKEVGAQMPPPNPDHDATQPERFPNGRPIERG